jgi:twinkle protein
MVSMISSKTSSSDKPGEFVQHHKACPLCNSSDAAAYRSDGSGQCFSCGKYIPSSGEVKHKESKEPTLSLNLQKINHSVRGIKTDVLEFYGVKYECRDDGPPVSYYFPRPDGTVLHRRTDAKEFFFTGEADPDSISLFGSDRFTPGQRTITITEGFFDALAVYQMQGSKYPAVAVQSAGSAKAECSKAYKYLDSFEKIYLAFDEDEPGQAAAKAVAQLFDFNKVFVVKLDKTLKDANAYLQENRVEEFTKAWWGAQRFVPEGILANWAAFDKIIDEDVLKPSIPYPFKKLQGMTYGIRNGELVLITAQEGIGKTEIIRMFEYDILKNSDANIGVMHLEENKARTLKGFAGYELKKPIHLPDFTVSNDELKKQLRSATGRDDRLHMYSHFGSDDPDVILSTVRFMAGACQCKYIFLDHITMVVSGLAGDDERRALDYISTQLRMMVNDLDFTLFLVSHVNDEGQTRGSRNIGKVADLRIDLRRDLKAESEVIRNTTFLTVAKNRYSGKTGPAGALTFNPDTYMLEEADEELPF